MEGNGPIVAATFAVRRERLYSIDMLRGAAAIAVVLVHARYPVDYSHWTGRGFLHFGNLAAQAACTYGYAGVYLFFVISGFCIHLRWARAIASGTVPQDDFIAFWKRRIRRLYPAYLVSLAIYVAIELRVGMWTPNADGVTDLVLHLFMLHNLNNRAAWAINGVYWTLAIEEQLYLAYFVLIRMRQNLGWVRTLFWCLFARAVWFVLSLALFVSWQIPLAVGTAMIPNWFVWALGAISVEAAVGHLELPQWTRSASIGVLCCVAGAMLQEVPTNAGAGRLMWVIRTPDWGVATFLAIPVWGVGFFCLVNYCVFAERRWSRHERIPWPARQLAAVGVFSYSLYLIHQLVLNFVPGILSGRLGVPESAFNPYRFTVLAPLSLVVAAVYFRLFEKPFLRSTPTAPSPRGLSTQYGQTLPQV